MLKKEITVIHKTLNVVEKVAFGKTPVMSEVKGSLYKKPSSPCETCQDDSYSLFFCEGCRRCVAHSIRDIEIKRQMLNPSLQDPR